MLPTRPDKASMARMIDFSTAVATSDVASSTEGRASGIF